MVYDSDFYTTRRTYTRPLSPHYTVTAVNRLPHIIPYVAHKKLATYIPYPVVYYTHHAQLPIRIYSSVRPSVLEAELRRIRNLQRTSNLSYVSRYLNSKDNIMFDDEARGIRATADSLLRKIHVFVPRPATSDFAEVIVPERMRSDDYIKRVLTSRKNLKKSDERDARHFGNGNLACVSYTAGKSHSRRRPYFKVADLRPADVQSDINLLSYYTKNRQAAASALPDLPLTDRELRKARALAEDRVYSVIRQASPDPEPVKRKDLAKVFEPVVQPDPEPIVEAQSEPVKELVSDPFRERKPISRKITKSERRSEPDIPIKSEPIVELELSPVVEPVFEGNIESLLEPIVVEEEQEEAATTAAAASVVESEPKSDVEAKQEPLAELESEQFAELEPEQFAETESESFAELKPESEPFEDVEQEPEPVAEPELEPEYVAEPEYVSESEPENHNELTQDSFLEFKSRQPEEELGFNFEEEEELTDRPEDEAAIVEPSDSIEPEIMPDLITNSEPGDLTKKIDESDVWPVRPESCAESEEAEEEVLQRKLDEDDLRRQVEELKRQAEEEKRKQAEEARLADERWKVEIEEKKRLEEEARQARFREIEEQERLEAARQKEEARIERERVRDEQIATEQRRAAEYEAAVAQEEEERFVIEKASEEARKRQENEEKLASEVASSIIEEPTALDSTSDECHCHDNVNSHDGEERVDSPDADDDTQIEEEAACMSPDQDEVSEHHVYDGENEGYNN